MSDGTEREAFPDQGDRPGQDEEGFVRCDRGHLGPVMEVDGALYCVACINLWVIKQAGLKPMRFFIRKRTYQAAPPKLIVPGRELPNEFERRG